jgi:hypothetical protein
MENTQEGDLLIIDDVSSDNPMYGAVLIFGAMKYEFHRDGKPHIYRELRETKLKVIK